MGKFIIRSLFQQVIMFSRVFALLSLSAFASAVLYVKDESHQKFLWESFKRDFNKNYETMEEESRRFYTFLENLKMADHRNELEQKMGGSAVHGITKFSDMSQAEFESKFLLADVTKKSKDADVLKVEKAPDASLGLIDWTGKYTTPVKDQGYCGSCWAFSATEQIESDAMRNLGSSYILSPEQVTQCTTTSYGCSGGWTESAYAYVKSTGGLETDANYPYTSYYGTTGVCKDDSSKYVIGISGFTTINSESQMASYVQNTGPLSVCLDANNWNSYTGGIMSVCGHNVDHCVQAVGVDASSNGFWKVRNSWGTQWGESGYIRLSYGSNTCDITNDPTYVAVKRV